MHEYSVISHRCNTDEVKVWREMVVNIFFQIKPAILLVAMPTEYV